MLCKYSKIFGEVNKGIHSIRIYNIAIIDVFLTILGAFIIHSYNKKYKLLHIIILLSISGIILHRVFCVRTTIDTLLFP